MFQQIKLKNFRNIESLELTFSPKVNIFIGDNGQGKSNLLEALDLLSTGQSFRYFENQNLIQKNHNESFLFGKYHQGQLDFDLQIQLSKERKYHFLNKKKISSAELSKRFPLVIFSPESLQAIKEGADLRRQLVDELLISSKPHLAALISEYKKALKMRNKILRDALDENTPKNQTMALLESLNPQFFKLATDLSFERCTALINILPDFNSAMQYISFGKRDKDSVDIAVEYVISEQNCLQFDREMIQKKLLERAFELRDAELSSGTSLIGPHKHDIRFLYNENDSRFYCSQGQQRALILAYKMAQIVYHQKLHESFPILLLDDVLSELDLAKREALINFLKEIDTQIFLTTTELGTLSPLNHFEGKVVKVQAGQVL